MNVFINPGHAPNGNPDPGAVNDNTGLRECDVALAVGDLVAHYLKAAGVGVTNVFQCDSLEEICDQANASGADLFISIHCNSAEAASATGTETWACAGSSAGHALAACIQNQIVDALGTVDRGVKTATPVLVELAFISNDDDEQLLEEKQDDFARAIARGVTDYECSIQ